MENENTTQQFVILIKIFFLGNITKTLHIPSDRNALALMEGKAKGREGHRDGPILITWSSINGPESSPPLSL